MVLVMLAETLPAKRRCIDALTRFTSQIGHEVNDKVEEDRVDNFVGQIGKHGSESLGRRVVAETLASVQAHK
jgi:hypothetical protein